jgi:trimethylamine--corrinoid protein Co-methyltransferase
MAITTMHSSMPRSLAFPTFGLLDRSQCEMIHDASLEILRRTGVRVYHPEALALLRQAGASIVDENLVRMEPALVQWALDGAPKRLVLCRRGSSEPVVRLEGQVVHFGPGSDCLHYLDPCTGEQRLFQNQDVIACIRLVDALPELSFCMSMGVPADLGLASPYRRQFALMLEHTVKPNVFVCDDRADCEAIVAMAASAAGGMATLRLNPTLLLYSEPSTPLRHSNTATAKLLYMAETGLPVLHSPAPMMGGTAPMTLAGGLALGNAEVLSGLVIHQLKRRGAPFVYGVQVHHMDMKTTISVYGAPEYQMGRVLSAQMGRYYGLPTWGNAGMSDSCALDEQAAVDATFSVMVALLTGTNLVHDVGYLEAGLTTSPELMVLTCEIIAMARSFMGGVTLDAETLALDVIQQVGPGGDYLAHEHTLAHFREFWQPALFSRQRSADWARRSSKRLGDRLRERTIQTMEAHRPEQLPGGVRDEIAYILEQG